MFKLNDKRRLYWLIDQYLLKKLMAWDFCDAYYESYSLETDLDTLTDKETKAFDDLAAVATRFTDIEEDLKDYPGVYYTPQELDRRILETKEALKDCWVVSE